MKTIVFCGPTLSSAEAAALLPQATTHGPAGFGDVYAAWRKGYTRIVLIDGYFDQRQAVWHKELLYALWKGSDVYGAASMGALRAVELERYGMQGFGQIFSAYQQGVLESDDEVVVAHESATSNYRATSVALINIRATLGLAAAHEVISETFANQLSTSAEGLFYTERSYRTLLAHARGYLTEPAIENFRQWLAENAVDQKRKDARGLLAALNASGANSAGPRSEFLFNETDAWDTFLKAFHGRQLVNE